MTDKITMAKIADKIRALMAKTTESGASEAESMAAAMKARELIDKYNITLSAVQVKNNANIDLQVIENANKDRFYFISPAIAKFTDCKTWTAGNNLIFMGCGPDTGFALQLYAMLRATRDRELKRYRGTSEYHDELAKGHNGRALGTTFTQGFVARVSERLKQMKSESAPQTTGQALVIVKNQVIDDAMRAKGIKLRTRSISSAGTNSRSATEAGRRAGDRASFNRGVANSSHKLLQ